MPGIMNGMMTLVKVCHSDAPRSFDASSSCRLKPTSRERTTMVTNGKQNATCAMMMLIRLNGQGRADNTGHHARGVEEQQQRHTHADFRDDDGQSHERFIRAFGRELEAPQHDGSHGADDGGNDRCDEGNGQRVEQRVDQVLVVSTPSYNYRG